MGAGTYVTELAGTTAHPERSAADPNKHNIRFMEISRGFIS